MTLLESLCGLDKTKDTNKQELDWWGQFKKHADSSQKDKNRERAGVSSVVKLAVVARNHVLSSIIVWLWVFTFVRIFSDYDTAFQIGKFTKEDCVDHTPGNIQCARQLFLSSRITYPLSILLYTFIPMRSSELGKYLLWDCKSHYTQLKFTLNSSYVY